MNFKIAILMALLLCLSSACGIDTTAPESPAPSEGPTPVEALVTSDFRIQQDMRLSGAKEWAYAVDGQIGDLVEVQIQYQNTGAEIQQDVMILDILPDNLEYVPGSTILYCSSTPDGAAQSNDIVSSGLNIGHHGPAANAFVRFTAKVVDVSLQPGSNTLVNWSQGCVNQQVLQDYSTLHVDKR